MLENLPQRASHIEAVEKRPSMEGRTVVENMVISGGGVLIKVMFPRSESVAKIFMLIPEPVSEGGKNNYEKVLREAHSKKDKKIVEETFNAMNSPLVFRNPEEMQSWFDLATNNYGLAECKAIADFLGIENRED